MYLCWVYHVFMLILSYIYVDFIMYLCWFYHVFMLILWWRYSRQRWNQGFKGTLKTGFQGNAETRAPRERWNQGFKGTLQTAFKATLKPGLQGNAETRAPMERWKQAFKATLKPGLQGNAETRAPREPWKLWNPWKPWPWKPENFENLENLEAWNCLHKTVALALFSCKRWCDMRANLHYGLNNLKLWCPPWPSCANKYSAPYRPDFGRNLGLEILEKLETWNCLHKTFRASTWDFKRWCDLRANLHYGLNLSKFWVRPWPSCANKCSAHFRPDFGRNLKFPSFQGIQGFKASPLKSLKNLKLGIVCTRRWAQFLIFANGGVTCAPTCTMD